MQKTLHFSSSYPQFEYNNETGDGAPFIFWEEIKITICKVAIPSCQHVLNMNASLNQGVLIDFIGVFVMIWSGKAGGRGGKGSGRVWMLRDVTEDAWDEDEGWDMGALPAGRTRSALRTFWPDSSHTF